MHLGLSISSASLLAALFTGCLDQGSSSSETSSTAEPFAGRVVAEIDPRIWVLHQGRNGDHWFGSNGMGVYRYDGQRVTRYTETDGLHGSQVRDIQEDGKGNIFVSTDGGVSRYDGKRFTPLEVVEAPAGGKGWRLDPEDVWIVYYPGNHGPLRYDGETLYHLQLPKSPAEDAFRAKFPDTNYSPSDVYSLYEDRRGHLWFGTSSVGLCRFDGQTLSWMYEEHLTTTPEGGSFGIRSIYEDRSGDFWITNTRHRFRVSPEVKLVDGYERVQYEATEGLPDARSDTDANFTYYPSMTEDAAGALWMACGSDGVWRYDGEDVTRFSVGDGAYAICILCDQEGKLWAGTTEHGLYTFGGEGEGFEAFRLPEPKR